MDFNATNFPACKPGRFCQMIGRMILLAVIVSAAHLLAAQEETVLATVNGDPITAGQVERELARTMGKVKLSPNQLTRAKSLSLEQQINQRVILDFLQEHKLAAGENEVRLKMEELKRDLATVEKTIEDYLEETKQTLEDLKFHFAWQLSWKRYLDQMLTDEFLASHFEKNRRQFDGTELRVAHLLLKWSPTEQALVENQTADFRQQAARIKSQIDSGETTWDQAVAQNSDAPTKDSGGEIGWIKWTGPMPDAFTRAAFKLAAGELSEPVQTSFGLHIIRCVEVKPGKLGWRDRIEEVKKSATLELFDAVVAKHRPKLAIQYNASPVK